LTVSASLGYIFFRRLERAVRAYGARIGGNMKKLATLSLTGALVGVLGVGLAAVVAPSSVHAQDRGRGGEATTYDFEDDLVTGDLVRPDGELLNVRRRGERRSLIRIREHFIPEMLKSVENL
jgi:hypothetical protein